VRGLGDAWTPGTIAAAVWSGRRFAEEFETELPSNDVVSFRREVTGLAPLPLLQTPWAGTYAVPESHS
jgi:dimethylamine/trimethylamine dehydrogenase